MTSSSSPTSLILIEHFVCLNILPIHIQQNSRPVALPRQASVPKKYQKKGIDYQWLETHIWSINPNGQLTFSLIAFDIIVLVGLGMIYSEQNTLKKSTAILTHSFEIQIGLFAGIMTGELTSRNAWYGYWKNNIQYSFGIFAHPFFFLVQKCWK